MGSEAPSDIGTVRFDLGPAELRADDATVTVADPYPGARDRLKAVLAEHLERFAFREAPQ